MVLGLSRTVALVILYGLMALFLVLMHGAAREVFEDRRTALAIALSAFGFWFYGWEALRHYLDSLVLVTALAATVWAILRLGPRPATGPSWALEVGGGDGTPGPVLPI